MSPCTKAVALFFCSLTLILCSAAQDTQRFEVFGGYSLLHDGSVVSQRSVFNGWELEPTVFFTRWFGITGDVTGTYGTSMIAVPGLGQGTLGNISLGTANYNFLAGPHFVYRKSRYAPFAQALFGGYHYAVTQENVLQEQCVPSTPPTQICTAGPTGLGGVERGFAMTLGGGLDIDVGHGISIRPVQAEYLLRRYTSPSDAGPFANEVYWYNGFRYSAGVTFRFGQTVGKAR
jgi:hypothetical protein